MVVTLQDMTALEELERLRTEFQAMVSHELRIPLTSIKGSIATLLNPTAALNPAETLQFHRIIDSQTDRMRELISDLLDVAHIETGALSVSPEPVNVAVLVDEARNAFLGVGGRNNLSIDIPTDLPWVMADRLRIVQVLSNLLGNADRRSPEESVILVRAAREGVDVEVSVADEGTGVPADLLPHLFGKFTRIDDNELRSGVDGSGLGLAICKGIVEAHGGRIWPRAKGRTWERGSPSRFPPQRRHRTSRQASPRRPRPAPQGGVYGSRESGCAFLRWPTTPKTPGTFAMRLPERATRRL